MDPKHAINLLHIHVVNESYRSAIELAEEECEEDEEIETVRYLK